MSTLFGMFPFLKTLFAGSGYQRPQFAKALAKVLPHLDIEIVKRSDQVSGFFVVCHRHLHTQAFANSICEAYSEYGRCKNTEEEDSKVQEYSENVPAVFRD